MKKLWPLIFLCLFVAIVFKPFIFEGKIPIPADTIVGLYHPWRDLYSDTNPAGVPFKNFLITDSVRQQYPWRSLALEIVKEKKLPVWNPYSFSGTPLLANFQTALFYPLNILFIFPDFPVIWGILVMIQPLLGSLFMYFYLKNFRLHSAAAVTGALAWIGSGFFVAWLEWNTVVHAVIWLPLILLAMDKFLEKRSLRWGFTYIFALFASFTAGYLQPFIYVFALQGIYLLARVYKTKKYKGLLVFITLNIIFLILTLPQLIPTLEFIGLSARGIDQANWTRPDWFLPWQNLAQFVAPDYFGNPATLNYFGIWNYQEFVGYIGISALIVSLIAIFFRRDKKTYFFTGILLLALVLALPNPISKIPFQFHFPFFNTAQPSRIILLVDFSLAVLAALGLDFLFRQKFKWIYLLPVCLIGFIFLILWVSAPNAISHRNLYLPVIMLVITGSIVFASKSRILFLWLIPLVLLADLTRFAVKFEPFSPKEYLYPPTKITKFLQEKSGKEVFRVASLDDRILPPNFNVMYKIQMPSGYDPLYLKSYGQFIVKLERGNNDVSPPWGFNRIITPKNYKNPKFKYLNVKYLLSLNELPGEKLVLSEGETKLYENKNYSPRVYFENNSGKAVIKNYQPNLVVIDTSNEEAGYLVLLDTYYPSWRASIDGKSVKINIAHTTFRKVLVPKGSHTVRFEFQ